MVLGMSYSVKPASPWLHIPRSIVYNFEGHLKPDDSIDDPEQPVRNDEAAYVLADIRTIPTKTYKP